jgi:hypothetical protein
MQDSDPPQKTTGSNLDLLLQHVAENSLARELVTACRGLDPATAAAAVNALLQARVTELRNDLQHANDQLD